MKQVLLTVSGTIDPALDEQIARGQRPRADYVVLARAFDADVLDYAAARRVTGRAGRLIERVAGPALMLAWACFVLRRRYRVIFTDGEQVGIPLALLLKLARDARVRHLMIVHVLSVRKKALFLDLLRVQSHIHTFLVYATRQKQFIEDRWSIPSARVIYTPFMVDHEFFAPRPAAGQRERMICAVGLERRDYPTLLQAVRGLDVDVVIAAASPWSRRSDTTEGEEIPPNVRVQRFSQYELRDLYARSRFVVMPLFNVDFQAGITAILEAMAIERAVICTRTPGQTDAVVDGVTGLYVSPGDPVALRAAIVRLLESPETAAAMGRAGRARVEAEMSLDCYAARLQQIVQHAVDVTEPAPVSHSRATIMTRRAGEES